MVNKVILVGNVGRDPEIRSFSNGGQVASFVLATSEKWKDKDTGERKEKTEWHNISVTSQGLVGVVEQYVRKGMKLYLEGQMQTRKWQDKEGADRYTTEVVLRGMGSHLEMLSNVGDSGGASDGSGSSKPAAKKSPQEDFDLDDDIPF